MIIAVVDGMGGGLGAQLVASLVAPMRQKAEVIALGTNALATNAMLRAGASRGASGDNAILVTLAKVDIVTGPIGIIMANSMMGEVTPQVAAAVADAAARKVLLPVSQSHVEIIGLEPRPLGLVIREAVARIGEIVEEGNA
ncbi:MAG: DUF3842 family protein [Sporomusaceae bacterium]|nr:DUF3842 family protein [Sporomusaceae bacterium]